MKVTWIILFLLASTAPASLRAEAADVPATAAVPDPWIVIKDYPYPKRTEFAEGAGHLLDRLDEQIRQLNAKRATLPETSTKDWDFSMKTLVDARSYLQSMIVALGDATFETWDQAKGRISEAWQNAQVAYDKVKKSTTA